MDMFMGSEDEGLLTDLRMGTWTCVEEELVIGWGDVLSLHSLLF